MAWTSWGPTSAYGTATLFELTCNPDCASGGSVSGPANVTLGNPGWLQGEYLFRTITVTPLSPQPYGEAPFTRPIPL